MHSANQLVGGILERTDAVSYYFSLKSTNNDLVAENARLRRQIGNLDSRLKELSLPDYCDYIDDSTSVRIYNFLPAKVIQSTTNKPNNHLTINKGSRDGIKTEMGVISSNGIVGVVQEVSPNFAVVNSVLHKDMKFSVELKNSNHRGSLNWGVQDLRYAILEAIPKHASVEINDTIITTGQAILPADIVVGTIEDITILPGSNFYEIKVRLSTDFSNLEHVYVVDYIYRSEQNELEAKSENE